MSGDTLHRLTEEGRRLVSDGFMRGETDLPDSTDKYVEPLPSGATGDLERLDEAVASVVAEHARTETVMDGALVVDVHESLDVSRRVAADPGLWHWLAVVRYPEFVRHRWEYSTEEAMREKFLGAGTDLYSNAIHRLWWIAELTHDGDDYTLTRAVFDNQTMVNKVFDRWFARYRPATVALCDELADEPSWVIDEVTRRFNHALTTVQLEGLDEAAARETITRIVDDVHDDA
jgi:hypothetical protein